MCHSSFPRLNDYGYRYRENGYQLLGRENDEKTVLESPPPFAARTSGGYNYDNFKNTPDADNINQFQVNGLDILSGGLFKENIGYIMVYPPEIAGSRGVAPQTGTLEMANVVFSHLGSSWLNLRAGRFEPAYVAFSVKRLLSVAPYEIYNFAFPSGPAFSETQSGIELYGYNKTGLKYAAGWINGSDANKDSDSPGDFFIRGVKVFGRGEGQTAGQRIGLTGYFGNSRPDAAFPELPRQSFNRFCADASLNWRQLNLSLQYVLGHDNKALWNTASNVDFNGGFAQINYMPAFDLAAFARFDTVNPDNITGIEGITRYTIGGRYYIYDNMALQVEYSSRTQEEVAGPNQTEKLFTTRLDFAL
jgi:hypothetical protein